MGFARHFRTGRLVALGGALGAIALLLSWSFGTMSAQATTPHPGLNFTLVAEGQNGCDTSGGDTVCYIDPGTEFSLNVVLESLPSDIPSYEAYDIAIEYTGLTSADDASTSSWPDCEYPAAGYPGVGKVLMGCVVGIPPAGPSTYAGVIGTNTFTCSESGTITLRHGVGNTILTETLGVPQHAEGEGTGETLNITCGSPPTPTSTPQPAVPTALPGTGTAGPDHGGSAGTGLWITIGALLAVAAAGAGVFGRRFARVAR